MTTLTLAAILQASVLATGAETYADAHRATAETGQPMVVMVGADWCPACQAMEQNIIPQVRRRGIFRRVAFATVNVDRERELATQLTSGGPIPQLIVFHQTTTGWRRRALIGGQTVETVESFIGEAVQANVAAAAKPQAKPDAKSDAKPAASLATAAQKPAIKSIVAQPAPAKGQAQPAASQQTQTQQTPGRLTSNETARGGARTN
jgi:thioredoxin-like negative regulator of GroEL